MFSKFALGLSPLLLIACGGVVRLEGDGRSNEIDSGGIAAGGTYYGAGGSVSQGGYPGPGRAGSGPVSPGGGPTFGGSPGFAGYPQTAAGGAIECCEALPTCRPGDKQINQPCPPGLSCYQSNACCSTITCVSVNTCATPSCRPGDIQIGPACSYPCYSVSSPCGASVNCLPVNYYSDAGVPIDGGGGPSCNPSAEYYRNYVGYSPGQCAVIDYGCPFNTSGFNNACGCGCEQRRGCPEWVDCMPSNGPTNLYCTDAGQKQCPYTKRAL